MKKIIFATLLTVFLCACTKETIKYQNPVPGQNGTEANASLEIASRNTLFTSKDATTGSIAFKSLGGKVVLDVNTNADWTFEVSGEDASFLTGDINDETNQLTLSCDGNKVEKVLSATVSIKAGNKTATIDVTQNAYGTVEIVASENNLHLAAKGELNASFEVTSTDSDWTFETAGCEWMLVSRDGNTVNISVYQNEEPTDREVKFILTAGSGDKLVTETIDVLQDRAALIQPSVLTLPVNPFNNEAKEIEVNANFDWTYSVTGNDGDWLTIERTENGFKFTAVPNPGEESRTVKITVTTGDGKENIDTKEITVSQTGIDTHAFIIGLNVTSTSKPSIIPVSGIGEGSTVDWGDGNTETVTSDNPSHAYSDPGYYVVSFKGSANAINSSSLSTEQRAQITEVFSWGDLGVTSMASALYNCGELVSIPADAIGSFAKTTTFKNAFYNCQKLQAIPEGLLSKAVECTDINSIFIYGYSITEIPANLLANCPKLKDATSAFDGCKLVTSIDKDLFAHNPELEICSSTFSRMFKLQSIDEDMFVNNPKITTFNAIFNADSALTSIPAGLFRKQTECESFRMAFTAAGITEIPAGLFENNTKCTTFQQTFNKTKIKTIPEDLFKGCSQVTSFMTCFSECTEL